jgi:hypothetical protein
MGVGDRPADGLGRDAGGRYGEEAAAFEAVLLAEFGRRQLAVHQHDSIGRCAVSHVDGAQERFVQHNHDAWVLNPAVELYWVVAHAGEGDDRGAGALRAIFGESLKVLALTQR